MTQTPVKNLDTLKALKGFLRELNPTYALPDHSSIEVAEQLWVMSLLDRALPSSLDQVGDQPGQSEESPQPPPEPDESKEQPHSSSTDAPTPTGVEASLAKQLTDCEKESSPTSGSQAKRETARVEDKSSTLSRIDFTRQFNRLARRAWVRDQKRLNITQTIKKTVASGGVTHPVFEQKIENKTHLIILFDRAPSMVAYFDIRELLSDFAREVRSYASVDLLSFDSTAESIFFYRGRLHDKEREVKLSSLCTFGILPLVLVVSDSLGERCVNGELGASLKQLPAESMIIWLHPWSAETHTRTPIFHSAAVVLKARSLHPTGVHLPIIPMTPEGLSTVEAWARGHGGGGMIGRRLPSRVKRQPIRRPVRDEERVDWHKRALNFNSSLRDPIPMQLLSLAACVPGRGLDLNLFYALGERFCSGQEIKRDHVAMSITSGFLQRVEVEDRGRLIVGFKSPEAHDVVRGFISAQSVDEVLSWIVETAIESDGTSPFPADLQIPVDLLLRELNPDALKVGQSLEQWDDEVKSSLIQITKATQLRKWRSLLKRLESERLESERLRHSIAATANIGDKTPIGEGTAPSPPITPKPPSDFAQTPFNTEEVPFNTEEVMLRFLTETLEQTCSCRSLPEVDPSSCARDWHTFRGYRDGRAMKRGIVFLYKDRASQGGTFKISLNLESASIQIQEEAQELGYSVIPDPDELRRVIVSPPAEPSDQQIEHMKTWIRRAKAVFSPLSDLLIADTPIAVFDLETTGLSFAQGAEIVEVSVVRIEPNRPPFLAFDSLIKPNGPVRASQIHKIYPKDVIDAPTFSEAAPALAEALSGAIWVAYNASFDVNFIRHAFREYLKIEIDPVFLCAKSVRGLLGLGKGKKLSETCADFGIEFNEGQHIAVYDTWMTARLMRVWLDRMVYLNLETYGDLTPLGSRVFLKSFSRPLWRATSTPAFEGPIKSRYALDLGEDPHSITDLPPITDEPPFIYGAPPPKKNAPPRKKSAPPPSESTIRFTLRPYQRDAVRAITRARIGGVKRMVVILPTGSGKTVIFSHLASIARRRVLVLAHREELLSQAQDKLQSALSSEVKVEIEQGQRRASSGAKVVVSSLRSLAEERLKRLIEDEDFGLIIYDECHHAVAEDNQRVLRALGVFDQGFTGTLVGFTASTKYADGLGLDEVFERVVYSGSVMNKILDKENTD